MTTRVQSFLDGSSSFLQVTSPTITVWMSLNFGKIPSLTSELAALERLKKTINSLVTTLTSSFLIGSSSFMQVTSTTIKTWMGLEFCQIKPRIVELAALERLKKSP